MNRAFIVIAVVTVALGLGAAAYFYYSSRAPSIVVTGTPSTTLPSGGGSTTTTSATTTVTVTPANTPTRLAKVSVGPVVPGEVITDVQTSAGGSSTDAAISYIERQSGNVYRYLVHAGTVTRTSNRTIPGIESALWLPDGSTAFVQYLSGDSYTTINTYGLYANGSGGFFLPQNLAGLAVGSTTLLTLASGPNGSVASLAGTNGTNATPAFTTPLSSVRVALAGKGQYVAFTKPSATLAGDALLVKPSSGVTRIAGPLNGLVALPSPGGTWVLVSYTAGSRMDMELVNSTTGEVVPLPIATIADKCVWASNSAALYCGIPMSPSGEYAYPDDWYQGAVSFNDRIWKIDVSSRFAQLILDFNKETSGTLDAEALAIDPLGSVLTFVNKNDGSLWAYQL